MVLRSADVRTGPPVKSFMKSPTEIAEALGLDPAPFRAFSALTGAVSIDSRSLQTGDLFFCIVGPNNDGHRFAAAAVAAGAAGIVASTEAGGLSDLCARSGVPLFLVSDTTRALADLAGYHRGQMAGRVVAITGSSGKTSTKEILAGIGEKLLPGAVSATRGNLNNHWGLPLSILATPESTRLLFLELGMNHAGEIAYLSRIARPDAGLIVSIGGAHIGHFGTLEAIARAKLEIVEGMVPGSVLLYHKRAIGLKLARELAVARRLQLIEFGVDDLEEVQTTTQGIRFEWRGRSLLAPGAFNAVLAENRIAAMETLVALGFSEKDVAAASEEVAGVVPGRFVMLRRSISGKEYLLIDDTYNANEASFAAAVRAARALNSGGRLAVVAGEMGELGEQAGQAHRAIGTLAAQVGCHLLLAVGTDNADLLAEAFVGGSPTSRVQRFTDCDSLIAAPGLLSELSACDVVLVKGSRSARMEKVVEALREQGYV